MLKKTITYTDYDGKERTEDFYFHLTKAEVIQWLTTNGDYTIDKVLERLTKKSRGRDIIDIFEDLIKRSYGEKSEDGRRFIKSPEVLANFVETEAYSVLFTELVLDANKAAEFFSKILPSDIGDAIDKVQKEHPNATPEELTAIVTGSGTI